MLRSPEKPAFVIMSHAAADRAPDLQPTTKLMPLSANLSSTCGRQAQESELSSRIITYPGLPETRRARKGLLLLQWEFGGGRRQGMLPKKVCHGESSICLPKVYMQAVQQDAMQGATPSRAQNQGESEENGGDGRREGSRPKYQQHNYYQPIPSPQCSSASPGGRASKPQGPAPSPVRLP